MQNKAKVKIGKISLRSFITSEYEKMDIWPNEKTKAICSVPVGITSLKWVIMRKIQFKFDKGFGSLIRGRSAWGLADNTGKHIDIHVNDKVTAR